MTQLRRNGGCCPGEAGARGRPPSQATSASACGVERITEGRQESAQGNATLCALYSRKEGPEGITPQLLAMPPGFPFTFITPGQAGGPSTPLPYLHVCPRVCASYPNSSTDPNQSRKGRKQLAIHLLTLFQPQSPFGKQRSTWEGPLKVMG